MSKIVCFCKNISEAEIVVAIENGAKILKDIQDKTGACTGNKCAELNPTGKCCAGDINAILKNSPTKAGKCCCCGN